VLHVAELEIYTHTHFSAAGLGGLSWLVSILNSVCGRRGILISSCMGKRNLPMKEMMRRVALMLLIATGALTHGQNQVPPPTGTKRTFIGFKLTRIDPGSIYETVGLREGDLLKSLNGRPIRAPSDLQELPAILKRDRRVELKVERGNKNVTLRYAMKTVALKRRVPAQTRPPSRRRN
jgi:hypothetical protein